MKASFGIFRKSGRAVLAAALISCILLSGCGIREEKTLFDEASALLLDGAYAEAEQAFTELASNGQYTAESYRGLGIALLFEGDYPDADIAFSKALLYSDSDDPAFLRDVREYTAYCRYKTGKIGEAKTLYDELIAEKPDPDLLYLRGRINMAQGNVETAQDDFRDAVSMSDDYNLYISIYELYKEYNMNADGADFLRDALAAADRSESDSYGRGVVEYYLENYSRAKTELIAALREDPDNERAVLLLGKTYLAMDDAADARAMYREHMTNPACEAASCNGLALCDLSEGEYESALSNIQKGLALHDDGMDESLLYNEIIVYEHMQDWESAKSKAAAFAARYPTNEAGQKEYAFLSTR